MRLDECEIGDAIISIHCEAFTWKTSTRTSGKESYPVSLVHVKQHLSSLLEKPSRKSFTMNVLCGCKADGFSKRSVKPRL